MLAYCHTYRRSDLRYHTYILIFQCTPYIGSVGMDGNRAGRTNHAALSAVDTLSGSDCLIERRNNHCFCTAVYETENADALEFLAGTYTVSAKDTLVRVTNDRWRGHIDFVLFFVIFKTNITYSQLMSQLLQLTLTAVTAGRTVTAVGSQQKLHN